MIKPWKKVGSKPVGDFRIFKMRADTAVNPRTGEEIKVKAGKTVRFKASPTLKKSV